MLAQCVTARQDSSQDDSATATELIETPRLAPSAVTGAGGDLVVVTGREPELLASRLVYARVGC